MNVRALFFIFIGVLAGLNLGSVRKTEDPIRDTQTSPILYEQKKEEEKDGKKGPLMYHVRNNPREAFFIDPPFEKEKEGPSESLGTKEISSSADTAGWWEEQSLAPQAVLPTETASEALPESLTEEEKVRDLEAAESPTAVPEAENAPPVKGDDYWW